MTEKSPVRVRFAPSPTGYLHVGGARTAIYNYFFAKHMGGTFYLRIEDTDRKRYNETALHDLMRDLKWLGLQWDEGPGCEGDCGPYFQSERLDIYHREIKKLLDAGYDFNIEGDQLYSDFYLWFEKDLYKFEKQRVGAVAWAYYQTSGPMSFAAYASWHRTVSEGLNGTVYVGAKFEADSAFDYKSFMESYAEYKQAASTYNDYWQYLSDHLFIARRWASGLARFSVLEFRISLRTVFPLKRK